MNSNIIWIHSLNCFVSFLLESPYQPGKEVAADWHFPHSKQDRLRYLVYKDLWDQGYFLSNGSKFGGDFLVYPGKVLLGWNEHYCKCIAFDHVPVFFLVPLVGVSLCQIKYMAIFMCIYKGVNKWMTIQCQFKSTLNSKKIKVRQILYTLKIISLQYFFVVVFLWVKKNGVTFISFTSTYFF